MAASSREATETLPAALPAPSPEASKTQRPGTLVSRQAGKQATIPATANGSFLWSDSTAPTTLPDGAHDEFIVVATNGIGLYTDHGFGAGCIISGGAISCTSDRAQKTDVSAIEARDVLERLVQMPITRWRSR